MKIVLSYILLSLCCFSFAQVTKTATWEIATKQEYITASEKATSWFSKTMNYQVNITYSSYTNHQSGLAHDVFKGFYKRNQSQIHSFSMGQRTIQNDHINLSVDSINKLMVLKNKIDISSAPIDNKVMTELLDRVVAIKKQKQEGGDLVYRLEFKPNQLYTAYEFKVNNKGLLTGITYFYSKELKKEKDKNEVLKGKPRLEIVFGNYQTNVSFNSEKEFSEKRYLTYQGKKIIVKDTYKHFECKDYRYTPKQ